MAITAQTFINKALETGTLPTFINENNKKVFIVNVMDLHQRMSVEAVLDSYESNGSLPTYDSEILDRISPMVADMIRNSTSPFILI